VNEAFDWLARHRHEPFPPKIDCETGSAEFARCYWVEMTRFNPSLRNDVLTSTRVSPGSGAYLDLGGFGYDPLAPGPGVLVGWLPEGYKGPLRLGDRIVSLGGREIPDGRAYAEMMDALKEEKATAVIVLRDGKRQRIETRTRLPERAEVFTVRVQAEFLTAFNEIQVISRGVAEMRLQVPAAWTPCGVNWNGASLGKIETAGCYVLAADSSLRGCSQ
jgi:hypothetical protein